MKQLYKEQLASSAAHCSLKQQQKGAAIEFRVKHPQIKRRIRAKWNTLRERGMAMPTMKRKKGMTKSARLQPCHGACPMTGHSPPAPSTSIISCSSKTMEHAQLELGSGGHE